MAKRRSKKQRQKNDKGAAPQTRLWPYLLFLFLVVGGTGVAMMHLRAPGGELNAQGLRVSGEGRSDASHVTSPELFKQPRIKTAYTIAQQIPATLNQLYCWCGCIERGMRSALECFESTHAAACEVCLGTAEVAWEMMQKGVSDAGAIQKVVDQRYGRSI